MRVDLTIEGEYQIGSSIFILVKGNEGWKIDSVELQRTDGM